MNSLNRAILIGRMTAEVVTRATKTGTNLGNFTLAVNESYRTQDCELKENVNFIDCVVWGKPSEIIAQYTRKGSLLAVTGKIKQERWEDSDGKKQSRIRIQVDSFQFLDNKKDTDKKEDAGDSNKPAAPQAPAPDDVNWANDESLF